MPKNRERFRDLLEYQPDEAITYLKEKLYHELVTASEWRTHDKRLSEDIVQEALFYVWKNNKEVAAIEDLIIEPYLFAIVKNLSITAYRINIRRRRNLRRYIREAAFHQSNTQPSSVETERDMKIWKLIETFPRSERECLKLKFQMEMSNEEMANYLSVGVKAVERSITSAYKRLKANRKLFM